MQVGFFKKREWLKKIQVGKIFFFKKRTRMLQPFEIFLKKVENHIITNGRVFWFEKKKKIEIFSKINKRTRMFFFFLNSKKLRKIQVEK